VGRLLARLAIPATVGMLVNALYNVVDALFVGRGVGALAIGGLAVAFPLQILIFGVGLLVGTGAASIVSRALGAQDPERASRTVGTAYTMGIVGGLLILGVAQSLLPTIVRGFGATEAIAPYAEEYLRTILFGAPFIVLAISSNHVVRAEGYAQVSMIAMILGAGTNIILDWLFIFRFGMGIAGAAMATVIGRCLAFVFLLVFLLTRSSTRLRLAALWPSMKIVSAILALGVATFVRQIGGSILAIALNNVLRVYGGDFYISAFGIVNRIMVFGFMPLFGIAQGFQPLAGYNFGARKMDRVRRSLGRAILAASAAATLFFLAVVCIPGPIIGMFTTEERLIRIAVIAIRRVTVVVPLLGLQVIGATFFLAIGRALPSLFLNMARQIIFLIPLVLILPRLYGVNGVWLAFPVADLLATVITIVWLILIARNLESLSETTTGRVQ
jgi:putative MATE family efflux protein